MPKKFVSCVKKVKRANIKRYGKQKYNPYAVCRKSTGFYGSTHHSKGWHSQPARHALAAKGIKTGRYKKYRTSDLPVLFSVTKAQARDSHGKTKEVLSKEAHEIAMEYKKRTLKNLSKKPAKYSEGCMCGG